jgi:hypothetical protein
VAARVDGFFGIASPSEQYTLRALDAHIRRRLRAILLRHWKRKRTIARRLIALGVPRRSAWRQVYAGRKSWWALSHIPAVDHGLRKVYFAKRWLVSLVELHRHAPQRIVAPESSQLALWGLFEVANRPAAGGHNPPSRGAVYDQRTYGSVGAGAGNRPGYPSEPRSGVLDGSEQRTYQGDRVRRCPDGAQFVRTRALHEPGVSPQAS